MLMRVLSGASPESLDECQAPLVAGQRRDRRMHSKLRSSFHQKSCCCKQSYPSTRLHGHIFHSERRLRSRSRRDG